MQYKMFRHMAALEPSVMTFMYILKWQSNPRLSQVPLGTCFPSQHYPILFGCMSTKKKKKGMHVYKISKLKGELQGPQQQFWESLCQLRVSSSSINRNHISICHGFWSAGSLWSPAGQLDWDPGNPATLGLNQQQTSASMAGHLAGRQAGFGLSWDCKLTVIEVEAKMKLKPGLSWLPCSWLK